MKKLFYTISRLFFSKEKLLLIRLLNEIQDTLIKFENGTVFQSYDSIIAVEIRQKVKGDYKIVTYLTKDWDYSTTTGKYRNQFLGENKKETQAKIDNGTYKLLT